MFRGIYIWLIRQTLLMSLLVVIIFILRAPGYPTYIYFLNNDIKGNGGTKIARKVITTNLIKSNTISGYFYERLRQMDKLLIYRHWTCYNLASESQFLINYAASFSSYIAAIKQVLVLEPFFLFNNFVDLKIFVLFRIFLGCWPSFWSGYHSKSPQTRALFRTSVSIINCGYQIICISLNFQIW